MRRRFRAVPCCGFLAASILASAPAACCQSAGVDAARVTLGVDSLDVILSSNGGERRVGRLWDELRRVEIDGVQLMRRVYRTDNAVFGPSLDTTYSTWPGLRPRAHKSESRRSAVEVECRGDSVVGHRSVTLGAVVPIARRLAASAIDGVSFDLIIRASPLAQGFRLSSQGYLAAGDSLATLTATVTGQETWRAAAGGSTLRVWVVQMNFAGLESRLWIDASSRALVRQTIRLTPAVTMLFTRPGMQRVGG